MSGFKFNFTIAGENEESSDVSEHSSACSKQSASDALSLTDSEVVIETFHFQLLEQLDLSRYEIKQSSAGQTLQYITCEQLKLLLKLKSISANKSNIISRIASEFGPLLISIESQNSDLIPNSYEGGMKVWECAYDLVDFLMNDHSIPVSGSRVLDLGCGIGLPGIAAMLRGASKVHFHDYNKEVLSFLTIPSTLANSSSVNSAEAAAQTRFFYGDWDEFVVAHQTSGEPPYDVILTSETIYSVSSQPKLLRALKYLTNRNGGLVVMAAKTHYFGVGGSVGIFQDLVVDDGYFEMSVTMTTKTSVPRQIIFLKPKVN